MARRVRSPRRAGNCLDDERALNIADSKTDRLLRQMGSGGIRYRQIGGRHARYSTVQTILNPAPEDKNKVNEFLTGSLNLESDKPAGALFRTHSRIGKACRFAHLP